ncbi:hypothetical protein MIMGU_mgv11b015708mg [Erythranthe guttata]|uniref:Uncharacterized protein n=1 Tax=Erythranthe guttata TaxID=4155 RepID=A0A022RMB8_ERYGU|nr:hypothetical protein MIMGU_mgv11b015708mg [Erythranthe guttata]
MAHLRRRISARRRLSSSPATATAAAHGYVPHSRPYLPHRPRLCSDSVFAVIPPQNYYMSNNNYYATTTRSTYHVQEEDQTLIFNASNIHHHPRQQEHADRTAAGLSDDQITKCLKIKININSCRDIEESEVCVICFDDLCQENNNNIGVLECGHEYHSDCSRMCQELLSAV